MAKFYKIQIGTIHLTSDGLTTGLPCKLSVSGVSLLRANYVKTPVQNADGSQIVQTYEQTSGKPLEIRILSLPLGVGNQLVTLFNSLAPVTVIGTEGDTGDFNKTCEIVSFDYQEFRNGRWKNAVLKLVTV